MATGNRDDVFEGFGAVESETSEPESEEETIVDAPTLVEPIVAKELIWSEADEVISPALRSREIIDRQEEEEHGSKHALLKFKHAASRIAFEDPSVVYLNRLHTSDNGSYPASLSIETSTDDVDHHVHESQKHHFRTTRLVFVVVCWFASR
jgi:hypothetical protein